MLPSLVELQAMKREPQNASTCKVMIVNFFQLKLLQKVMTYICLFIVFFPDSPHTRQAGTT